MSKPEREPEWWEPGVYLLLIMFWPIIPVLLFRPFPIFPIF